MEEGNIKIDDNFVMKGISSMKSHTENILNNPWSLSTFVLGILTLFLVLQSFGFLNGNITGNVVSQDLIKENVNLIIETLGVDDFEISNIEALEDTYLISVLINGTVYPFSSTLDGEFVNVPDPYRPYWIRMSEFKAYLASQINQEVEISQSVDEEFMNYPEEISEEVLEETI